jgi:hypothetical protein|tara:strand:- start:2919 stop:3116 length:198 start_codon:yes stop_codon:yes gene_type:complete
MNEQDSNQLRDESIETMGQTLFDRFAELLDDDQETAKALHSEWVVDGQDPEEGDYEFIFVEKISS